MNPLVIKTSVKVAADFEKKLRDLPKYQKLCMHPPCPVWVSRDPVYHEVAGLTTIAEVMRWKKKELDAYNVLVQPDKKGSPTITNAGIIPRRGVC